MIIRMYRIWNLVHYRLAAVHNDACSSSTSCSPYNDHHHRECMSLTLCHYVYKSSLQNLKRIQQINIHGHLNSNNSCLMARHPRQPRWASTRTQPKYTTLVVLKIHHKHSQPSNSGLAVYFSRIILRETSEKSSRNQRTRTHTSFNTYLILHLMTTLINRSSL